MNERLIPMTKQLLLSLVLVSTAQAEWEALPSLPEPNGGFMCGIFYGKINIVGGTNWSGNTKNWLTVAHEFDPQTKTWSKIRDLDSPLAYGVSVQSGPHLMVLGGTDGRQSVRRVAVVDRERVHASPEILPATVVLGVGGMVSDRIIFAGGTDDSTNLAGVTRANHELAKDGLVKLAEYPGKPFAVAASVVLGDELFIFGGMNYDEAAKAPVNTTDAYAFSPAKNAWRKLKALGVARRGMAAVALDERQIYLGGGFAEEFTTDSFIYDMKTDSYRPAKSLPYAAMVALVKLDGFVYCLGGEDKKQSRTDKFYRIAVAELLK
jgi:N-acetylneuraminic acid mutarotase